MASGAPAIRFLKRINRKYLKEDEVLLSLGLSIDKNNKLIDMNDDNPGRVQDFTFKFLNFYNNNYKKLNTPMILSNSISGNMNDIGGVSNSNAKSKAKTLTKTKGGVNLYGIDDDSDETGSEEYIEQSIPNFLVSYISNNPNS